MDLSNQEYYVLLKRVNQNLVMTEFTLEKMNILKQKLIKLLNDITENSNPSDVVVLPKIFFVLKRSFFKLRKETIMMLRQINFSNPIENSLNRKNSSNNTSNDKFNKNSNNFLQIKYKDENEKKNFNKNGELLLEAIKVACNFLDVSTHEDISISALNYIYRFFEEPLHFEFDNRIHVVIK